MSDHFNLGPGESKILRVPYDLEVDGCEIDWICDNCQRHWAKFIKRPDDISVPTQAAIACPKCDGYIEGVTSDVYAFKPGASGGG